MKKFVLARSYLQDKTIGWFTGDGLKLVSLSRPWLNNDVNVSCIPEGVYIVSRDIEGRHRWYAVQDVDSRSNIEIHVGNTVADSAGCILLGMSFDADNNISRSIPAMKALLNIVGSDDFILTIRSATADDWS